MGREMKAAATLAERAGLDSLLTWDHPHAIVRDPMQPIFERRTALVFRAQRTTPPGRQPRPQNPGSAWARARHRRSWRFDPSRRPSAIWTHIFDSLGLEAHEINGENRRHGRQQRVADGPAGRSRMKHARVEVGSGLRVRSGRGGRRPTTTTCSDIMWHVPLPSSSKASLAPVVLTRMSSPAIRYRPVGSWRT